MSPPLSGLNLQHTLKAPETFRVCNTLELARPLLRPALDHNLLLGEELDCIHTLAVQIAKERLFPAREGEECHWRRDTDIDANVPRIHLVTEFARRRTTRGKQA